jgi:hypothetical protein
MTNEQVTYVVAGGCALIALAAFVWLIVRPAWMSYTGFWPRVGAMFLTLYVAAAFVGLGVLGGLAVARFWGRIEGTV